MRERVGAIIFEKESLVLIKRTVPAHNGQPARLYWVFPGGQIDLGESKEETLVRECKEELGIDVKIKELFTEFIQVAYGKKQREYFFLCDKVSGQLGTGAGPEFSGDIKYFYRGKYEVVLVPRDEIINVNLLPRKMKKMVMNLICSD